MVAEALSQQHRQETYTDLAVLMKRLVFRGDQYCTPEGEPIDLSHWLAENQASLEAGTLIRKLEGNLFNPNAIPVHTLSRMLPITDAPTEFLLNARQLPETIPDNWKVEPLLDDKSRVKVQVTGEMVVMLPDTRTSLVQSAGQLPSGFDPEKLYQARSHPRGLQMTVYAASDAIQSMGMDWSRIANSVAPDQMAVYASAAMSQLDPNGLGGMIQANLQGRRVTSKQCPLGLAEMPADFVNAYIIGSVGGTGANIGACATFLYNLKQGLDDIRSGAKRVVIVGASEAPLTPEVIEGYRAMGALAQDDQLLALDPHATVADNRRACRPFSDNCGFTLAEASHYLVLCDDTLALELGASIYGAVADVFVNADGFKKSISSPGVGNYVTMAKALASTRAILGERGMQRSYVQAHGTSTPQNRVTESRILNEVSKTFGLGKWPVAAIKSYVGHSLGSASADQVVASLGVWAHGIIPGIKTIDHLASDVETSHLNILMDHLEVGAGEIDAAIVNSKGFGGNNASAALLAPHAVQKMIARKHGVKAWSDYQSRNEAVQAQARQYDESCRKGLAAPLYYFGENVRDDADVRFDTESMQIKGCEQAINLRLSNPYPEMGIED